MFRADMESWLSTITEVRNELGWDKSLILTMKTDERTFLVQVRKSALVFTVQEEPGEHRRYTVTYTELPPESTPNETARRVTAGKSRSAEFVREELEKWLREPIARYAAGTRLPD